MPIGIEVKVWAHPLRGLATNAVTGLNTMLISYQALPALSQSILKQMLCEYDPPFGHPHPLWRRLSLPAASAHRVYDTFIHLWSYNGSRENLQLTALSDSNWVGATQCREFITMMA